MNKRPFILGVIFGMLTISLGCNQAKKPIETKSIDLNTAMSGDTTGYARAEFVRDITFPADWGPHPTFKTEWWYFTGNLDDASGRKFGYELTVFRSALNPPLQPPSIGAEYDGISGWATDQLYMGHFSLADLGADAITGAAQGAQRQSFHSFERFSRGAMGLAGSQSEPFQVWLEDWTMEGSSSGLFPLRLQAGEDYVSIDLTLSSSKPVVLQGDRGLDQKGGELGNASYYYSYTRLETEGVIRIGDQEFNVQGSSWKDHEWSTSALDENQVGWDWFALQLLDNREIMFYVLREKDGTAGAFTNGMLVESDGSYSSLSREDVVLRVNDTWTSPHSGATYPAAWTFSIPSHSIDLQIHPLMNDQELNATVRYWEGAVAIKSGGKPAGRGYVELTGYK
jgi:predicted secreted hydrolase